MIVTYAPRDAFLIWMLDGWRFYGDIAEPMVGHHGHYSVLMVR